MDDFGWFLTKVLAAVFGLLAVLFCLVMWGNSASCASIGTKMGVQYRWAIMTNCMVRVRGQWVPLDSYRVLQ